jgi:leader peptidase (prepilin peptidase)/N-methyltransferase
MEILIFLLGLVIGSFLNSIIYRLSTGESFLFKRSFCPHCKHQLSWQDLIPIFSFLILRGKCRYCSQKISLQYPLVELATGLLFVSFFIFHSSFFIYIIACFLIIIFVYDLKHYLIPDKIIYPAIAITFLYQLFRIPDFKLLVSPLLSALLASLFFLAIVLVSRGKWMGVGDIKLAFFIGLFLGWPNILVALFLAFFIGAIIGVGLIVSGKKNLKSEVPLGPFLVTGTFMAMLWGQDIINRYLNFWPSL